MEPNQDKILEEQPDTQKTTELDNIEEIQVNNFEEQLEQAWGNPNDSDATFTSAEPSLILKTPSNLHKSVLSCYLGHTDAVMTVAVHPVEKTLLASGGIDDRLFFFDTEEEKPLGELTFEETVNQVEFSADGQFLGVCILGGLFLVFEMVKSEFSPFENSLQIQTHKYKVTFY